MGFLSPVPPDSVVYGSGEAAVILTKVGSSFPPPLCHCMCAGWPSTSFAAPQTSHVHCGILGCCVHPRLIMAGAHNGQQHS